MKVSIDNIANKGKVFENVIYLDVEINDIKYGIRFDKIQQHLIINKIDFNKLGEDRITIYPGLSNQIYIK